MCVWGGGGGGRIAISLTTGRLEIGAGSKSSRQRVGSFTEKEVVFTPTPSRAARSRSADVSTFLGDAASTCTMTDCSRPLITNRSYLQLVQQEERGWGAEGQKGGNTALISPAPSPLPPPL